MNIIDVPTPEFQRAARRGRSRGRSQETIRLIEAIESLRGNRAKAIVPGGGEDPKKLRAKLTYAARIANRKLRIVVDEDRVVFQRARQQKRRQRGSAGADSG